jgi:hypothetical protein
MLGTSSRVCILHMSCHCYECVVCKGSGALAAAIRVDGECLLHVHPGFINNDTIH